jgi:5-methylcytosine-specific restriction enzyme A
MFKLFGRNGDHFRHEHVMDSRQAYEARREANQPWRAWHSSYRWQKRRAAQLRAQPMCAWCKVRGVDRPASVAHHIVPHHGDASLFWHGELSSLCKACHDSDAQRVEGGGKIRPRVDEDGWPIE